MSELNISSAAQAEENNTAVSALDKKRYAIILISLVALVCVLATVILLSAPRAEDVSEPAEEITQEEITQDVEEAQPLAYSQESTQVDIPIGEYARLAYTGELTGFASSDESIAAVSGSDVFGASLGTTTVSAIAPDGTKLEWQVNVKKAAYITIDDWPGPCTQSILDTLDEYNIKATFFMCAQNSYLDMYKKIADAGHTIGNHSFSHDTSILYESSGTFLNSLRALDTWLYDNFEITTNKLVRFPTGSRTGGNNEKYVAYLYLEKEGYRVYDWSATLGDCSSYASPEYCFDLLKETCTDEREVILMHHKEHTAQILPQIIEYLHSEGYAFSAITEHSPVFNFQYPNGWNIY